MKSEKSNTIFINYTLASQYENEMHGRQLVHKFIFDGFCSIFNVDTLKIEIMTMLWKERNSKFKVTFHITKFGFK